MSIYARTNPIMLSDKKRIIQSPLRMKLAINQKLKSSKIRVSFLSGTQSDGRT